MCSSDLGKAGPSLGRRQPTTSDTPERPKATTDRGQIVGRVAVIRAPTRSAIATTGRAYWSRKKQARSHFWAPLNRLESSWGA